MKELSLHILDVAENGINAGADRIRIEVEEAPDSDRLRIVIEDNGRGISPDRLKNVTDPFYTTRTTRRVGLGLSLFETAARQCNGFLLVRSASDSGTRVEAEFEYGHIDRAPLGDMAGTLLSLIIGYPDVEFEYAHRVSSRRFEVNTREVKEMAGADSAGDPKVYRIMRQMIKDGLNQLKTKEDAHGTIDNR